MGASSLIFLASKVLQVVRVRICKEFRKKVTKTANDGPIGEIFVLSLDMRIANRLDIKVVEVVLDEK